MTKVYDQLSTKVFKGVLADIPAFTLSKDGSKVTTVYAINLKMVAK